MDTFARHVLNTNGLNITHETNNLESPLDTSSFWYIVRTDLL